jgi:alpha-galactosidase/6-phospho-beta-glucosidase family protein
MKMIRFALILIVLSWCNLLAFADSPITSTPFASVYSEIKIIGTAKKAIGEITPEIIEYLSSPKNPVDVKMAVINELGWGNKIKNNASMFYSYLARKSKFKSEEEFTQKASGDELLAMAYLKAMDDYQEVAPAIKYAESALEKNPKSFTFNLIVSLIKAQKAMDKDWCDIYKITDAVRQNSALTKDMKDEAAQIIFAYTDSYKEFCK